MATEQTQLRRFPTRPDTRQFPEPTTDAGSRWRKELDDKWNFLSNPYSAWRYKRKGVENKLKEIRPNYTQEELEKVYDSLGLGSETSPGDFNREDSLWGSGSRAMSMAWNSMGQYVDAVQQYADWKSGDFEGVLDNQKQMEDAALENELINRFQSQTSYGKNVVTQFLFDLSASAPIMAGVMGAGIVAGKAGAMVGIPVWIASILGMAGADALSEMGFNWADIMSNPEVRRKMEAALGEKLTDLDEEAITKKVTELLMKEAEGSVYQVGVGNFVNPLNWNPVANKFSKLMKIGSGRMGTIGRQALGGGVRETIEEFAQSVGSQYTAAEAKMQAMGRAGVEDIPELGVDLKQAGYEALMGFAVGGPISGIQGSRGYSKFFDPNSDMVGVDRNGNPLFKTPNQKGFKGAGALRLQTRRMVDADNPVELNDWLNGKDEDGNYLLDDRERLIIKDEIERMKYGKELLGDKTNPEKLEQRKENAKRYEDYTKNPEAWIESQKSPEMREEEQAQREAEEKQLSDAFAEVEAMEPDTEIEAEVDETTEVKHKKTTAVVHTSVVPAISSILKTPANQRTPRQTEFLRLAQENPDMEYKDLDKMVTQIVSQMKKYGTQPAKPPPQAPKETKVGKGKPQATGINVGTGTVLTDKEKEAQLLEQILARAEGLDQRVTDAEEVVATGKPIAQATGGATLADTPTISEGILNKNDSVKEIMNTLKQQKSPYSKKEAQTLILNEIRDLKKAQGIKPIKNVELPDKIDKKTGELKTGRVQKTDYRLSADDRLIVLNNVSKKLGITPPKVAVVDPIAQGETVTSPGEVAEPDKQQYEKAEAATKELLKYKKNVDANNKEVDFDSDLDGLTELIGTEILIERADDSAKKSYVVLQDQYDAAPRGENEQAGVRKSDQLKANPGTKISRIMFMGFNKDGVPYFNLLGQRQDRSGQTTGVPVKEKEVLDRGAVAHLLGRTNKSFRNVNERKEGKKKFLVAEVSYTTAAPLEETLASNQATQLIAIEEDLSGWNNEARELEEKGLDTLTPEEINSYNELVEKIAAHNEEKALLLEQAQVKRDKVQVREGTGVKKEYIPLNALGTTEKDINTRKKNLRKLLKEHKNKETLPNEEVERVLNDIEIVLGKDQLEMDRDYGIEISQVTETKEIKDAEGNPKTVSVTIPSLKMAKSSPLDTSTLNYVLGFNGWRLVNPEMDAMTDNEFEVVVGDTVQVRGVPKYESDIIVDGVNYTQQDKDHAKFLNLKLEEQLKTRKDEWWGTREGLSDKEKASAQRQAKQITDDLDTQVQEGSLPGSAWKRSARQWFKTAAAQKNPPKKGRQGKSGWTTKKAIDMVRQQMKALDGVTNKEVDSMIDDQILEFLWEGPGEVGRPTVATTVVYDSANPDHKGFNVDVKFKNGVTEEIVPRWGQSIKSYQTLAEVIAASNATGAQVDLKPQGGKKGKKTPTKKAPTKKTKTDDKKETKYSAKELKALQEKANKKAEEDDAASKAAAQEETTEAETTTTEEVATPPAETTGVNTLGQINTEEDGELQQAMPDSDKKKYNNARFDKLKGLPRYQDVSVWDASALPQKKGEETKVLTEQIKLDLKEPKATGLKPLKDLIHRKLQDYLVLEIQTEENIEGLRSEIDERYWDLLATDNKKAVNTALVARGSTPLPLIRPKSRATTSKKKVKTEAPPIERAGFITDNVVSATISDLPTANPKLNDVWLIDPKESGDLFVEVATEKNLQELEDFLATTNNGDFFVVKKTPRWSDAYILFRGEEGAPVKGKRDKIPVPQAIVTRLSREGKFFNSQREDFPLDQRSHKLTRSEMTNRDDKKLSSELFMQLFKSAPVDINLLQKALDEDRITYGHDAGIDNFIEVVWLNEDGEAYTDGVFNSAMIEFKDRSAIEGFIADLRKKNPKTFDHTDREYKKMLDKEASQDIAGQVYEEFTDVTSTYIDNGGLRSLDNDGTIESAEVPLEDYNTINREVASDVLGSDAFWDAEAEAQTALDNKRREERERTGKTLRQQMAEQYRELSEKEGSVKRLAEPPPEGAEPVPLEVVNDIVGKFREEFPGSADITVEMGDSPGFKGLYVPEESGRKARIYLVANEHYSAEDVVQTLWHEGIGHGMQSLMTTQEFLELQQIVETSMPERFAEELEIVEETTEWGDISTEEKRSIAAQEVLADFANNLEGQTPTLLERLTTWLRGVYNNFANALGLSQLNLSEGDVRAILFESANAFRKPRPEGRADIYAKGVLTPDTDTSLRRRTFESKGTPFENTNLREASRSAWEKIYGAQTADTSAPAGTWWSNIRESLLSSLFDPFRAIKNEIGAEQYMVARLAGRADGIITTLLRFGGVNVQQRDLNGTLVNETVVNRKMKSLFQMLRPLGTPQERQRFFGWIAYNRAKNLLKQGKETFFTAQEINEGLTWNQGRIKNAETGVVGSREIIYERIQKEVAAMNNSVVDMGVKMGLLSKRSADNFAKDFYVPFYRIIEEEIGDGKQGNNVDYNSLTGQQGVKKLKGSKRPIGDPFNNLLHNWLHIIDASVKNDAANTTIKSGMKIQNPMDSTQMIVQPHTSPVNQANTVRVKQNGIEKRFNINNQLLYNSLTALSVDTKFPGFKYAISAKGLFTQIVTANPLFKYNNIIRDTITTAGTTDVGFNLYKNAVGGFRSLSKNQADMLVSGGYIQFAYTRGDDPKYAEKLLNKELSTGYIVENPETDKTFQSALAKATKMSRNLIDKYNKFGDKLENANRAAVFEDLIKKGKSQTEAAFGARDLMDFTLHGGASWVRLITSLTPFANAMLQGKYKLGRAVVKNPKPAAIVASAVLLAQLFEGMLHEDDEEYQRRPDWEKDTFWWVPIPGSDIKFLIPKPHEFAMVGNFAWRALQIAEEEGGDTGEALVSGIKSVVSREFGIVPIAQVVKPLIEVGMNRNLFFDRDIEPIGSQGRSPSMRYGQYTSETAIVASRALEYSPFKIFNLSPYQLEHLINGYFGWMGQLVLGVADMVTSTTGDFPARPARRLQDTPMARRIFKASPIRNTKMSGIFYDRLKEMEQTTQDMNLARKQGDMKRWREIYEDTKAARQYNVFLKQQRRIVNDINTEISNVRYSREKHATPYWKALQLDRLYQLRNDAIDNATKHAAFR